MSRPRVLFLFSILTLISVTARVYGLAESTGPGGSNAQAVHALGQIGADVNVGLIAAKSVYTQHYAFFDKDNDGNNIGSTHAFNLDYTGDGDELFIHDTWMAGIVASRGSKTHPNDIGIAPGTNVFCARVINDACQLSQSWLDGTNTSANGALDELINDHGCRIIMTGFAFDNLLPNGESNYTLMYDYYAETYDVIFTPGSGNGGGDIWPFGDIYNGIVTGGLMETAIGIYDRVGEDSSSGFTEDDRRKPDVVAPTQNQTMPNSSTDTWKTYPLATGDPNGAASLSGPHTAGVAALLLKQAADIGQPDAAHNETIKAIIVNSAFPNIDDKQGESTEPATTDPNKFWNCDRGYGRVDALRAYQLLNAGRVSTAETITQQKGWAYDTFSGSGTHTYSIQAKKNHRLVLTVTWNRKPTRSWSGIGRFGSYNYSDEDSPKFNIDLIVKDSNGVKLFEEEDELNNLEKVDLLLAKDDEYEIILVNTTGKSRDYGLAFELVEPLVADFNLDYIVDYNDLYILCQNWLEESSSIDVTGEGEVNFLDYSIFAANIGMVEPAYR